MDEKEFQKRNKELLTKRGREAKRRERQSASKISESCSTLMPEVTEKRQDPTCERCHLASSELVTVTEGTYSLLCPNCEDQRKIWVAAEAERALRQRREDRRSRVECRRREIERVIPKACWGARLRSLGVRFKEKLLAYKRETGLVLYGPTGTGKTWTLCALLRSLIASGLRCERIGYELLCLEIRDCFKRNSNKSEMDVVKEYLEADALLLEDVGRSKPIGTSESDFSLRVIFMILDTRLENERLTLISTNKSAENMRVSFDERIASRLSTFTWIGVGGRDKRATQS